MASPKIGPNFFGKVNYEKYISELITEGKIAGKNLSPSERKEGFKKKGNKIQFEGFVKKVIKRGTKSSSSPKSSMSSTGYLSGGSGGGIKSSASSGRKFSTAALVRVVNNLDENEPAGLDDLLNDIRRGSPTTPKIKRDDKILENIKETNKNLLETNEILYGLIKSLKKEMVEDKKRAFKEKDRLRKEKRKESFGSALVRSSSGIIAKGKKSSGGLFDNPLFKFLGLSALAGLVQFIPKLVEFVETLPKTINKFFAKDIPDFIGKKFEEFENLVGGFFTDRFNEVKQFFEDIYTGIDDFTGGRLTRFIEGIKGLGPMIIEKSQEFYKTVDDWTGGRISGAFDWIGKNVIDPLGTFFTEKIDYVKDEAGKLWKNFSSSFLNFFQDLGITDLISNTLGLEPAAETGPDLTQDLVAVGDTTAANIAPISGATGMAVEGMDAAQVANQISNINVSGKSVQLGTGLSQGGTSEDVQKQISGLREGGAKGVQVIGTGDAEKDAKLQEIVALNKDLATFLPAVKSNTGAIDYGATAAASAQQIQNIIKSQQPQRSSQPVSTALSTTLNRIDSGEMAHTTSGTRKPSVVSTSAVIPNRDSIMVTSRRGMRDHPKHGGQKMHQGTDIAAPSGTPLYAFTDGVITDRGHDSGYGNYIAWKDSFGSEHFYAHMRQMIGNVGDTVKAGTMIGKSGGGANDPGRGTSTGPHLHWEYGPEGQTGRNGPGLVDPLDKFDYMMPFGAKKITGSPEPTPAPAPKPTVITTARQGIQATADALSKTPSRASRSRVSNINLPAEVKNNQMLAGSSGGQSSSTENYVPRVSTRTSSDIYQINTRSLFNIIG